MNTARLDQVNSRVTRFVAGVPVNARGSKGGPKNRAVIYVRASLDHTGEGLSVQRQQASCESYCNARGWEVVEVCTDNSVSAYKGKARPGWEEALRLSRDGLVDHIVAWHIDRVTRNMKDLEELIQVVDDAGVSLATVEGDININGDTGRLIARILAAVAIGEVERKGARQKAAHDQRAAKGKRFTGGGRPFGFEVDGQHREDEAAVLRDVTARRLRGESWRALAADLNERGVRTTRGKFWDGTSISRTARHPRNAGILLHRGVAVADGDWEPIISYTDWLALADESATVGQVAPAVAPRGRTPRSLLAGLARCADHDRPSKLRKANGRAIYFFECCNSSMPTDVADKTVIRELFLEASSIANTLVREHENARSTGNASQRASELRQEKADLLDRIAQADALFAAGDIDAQRLTAITGDLTPRIEQIDRELVKYVRGSSRLDGRYSLATLKETWEELDLPERRRALQAYFERVDVKKRAHRKVPASAAMLTITTLDGRTIKPEEVPAQTTQPVSIARLFPTR